MTYRPDIVVVFDTDGVFTDGGFWSSKKGKQLKRFGCDDWDLLDEVSKRVFDVKLITADKKGFDIVSKRAKEKNLSLSLVSNKPKERWNDIRSFYDEYKRIIFVGDGVFDWYALREAYWSATSIDALDHVKDCAWYVSQRSGGNRFVADVCLEILKRFCDPFDIYEVMG